MLREKEREKNCTSINFTNQSEKIILGLGEAVSCYFAGRRVLETGKIQSLSIGMDAPRELELLNSQAICTYRS